MMENVPEIVFVQPFTVTNLTQIKGRVVVIDVAFNQGRLPRGMEAGTEEAKAELREQFEQTTLAFIEGLGLDLVAWVDHHPHDAWIKFEDDPRFHLFSREAAPSMPSVLSEKFVVSLGDEIDTIVAHGDMDGIIGAAIVALGGQLPYPDAVSDATAADTRQGEFSPFGRFLEEAMKADLRDNSVREAIYRILTQSASIADIIKVVVAQQRYAAKMEATEALAEQYEVEGKVAVVDAREVGEEFDLTQLLLEGQRSVEGAEVAIVLFESKHDGSELLTVAGPSHYNFPKLLGLSGGAPFRVTVSADRLHEVVDLVNSN